MKAAVHFLCGVLALCGGGHTWAQTHQDSCYVTAKIGPEYQKIERSTVILLDETVVFDRQQREHIFEQLSSVVEYGNEIRVVSFSAYLNGRYAVPAYTAKLASPLEDDLRHVMRKDQLRIFDTCQQVSLLKARRQLKVELEAYMARSSDKLAKSAIVSTLKEVGDDVFPSLAGRTKRIVIVSDMLENSDVSSFYASGNLRTIDPEREFSVVSRKQLTTDFRAASVYVIGAGVMPATSPDGIQYRSGAVMAPLKEFWRRYFESSNARLIEFGQPLLLHNLGESK